MNCPICYKPLIKEEEFFICRWNVFNHTVYMDPEGYDLRLCGCYFITSDYKSDTKMSYGDNSSEIITIKNDFIPLDQIMSYIDRFAKLKGFL
jgi:hypothetical protein